MHPELLCIFSGLLAFPCAIRTSKECRGGLIIVGVITCIQHLTDHAGGTAKSIMTEILGLGDNQWRMIDRICASTFTIANYRRILTPSPNFVDYTLTLFAFSSLCLCDGGIFNDSPWMYASVHSIWHSLIFIFCYRRIVLYEKVEFDDQTGSLGTGFGAVREEGFRLQPSPRPRLSSTARLR